jgi:hypothetical protein
LIPDKVFMGAAADVESMVRNESIEVVVVAAGTLLALGLSQTVDEAEARVKSIRNVIDIKPLQKESIIKLYPN